MDANIKMTEEDIKNCDMRCIGDWINKKHAVNNRPFKYCLIDNFLDDAAFESLHNSFPVNPTEEWWKYSNPLEVKYAYDNIKNMDKNVKNIFSVLSSDIICKKIGDIFDIDNLEYDPYCHGGGLHMHPKGGRLAMHLDYEKHPTLKNKQRRLNVILYANTEWKEEWNGDTQLWGANMEKCEVRSFPRRNRALIFETCEESWHGVPEIINCPEGQYRKSLAFYYLTDLESLADTNKVGSNESGYRTKACFVQRPTDPVNEKINKLMEIRPYRRITNEDMKEIWPEWNAENY